MTLDNGVDGAVKPSLTHSSGNPLLIESVGNDPGTNTFLPELYDFLDHTVLFWVYDERSIEPIVSIGEDRRTNLCGPLRVLLRSFGGTSKCVAVRGERLADRCLCEAGLLLYLA